MKKLSFHNLEVVPLGKRQLLSKKPSSSLPKANENVRSGRMSKISRQKESQLAKIQLPVYSNKLVCFPTNAAKYHAWMINRRKKGSNSPKTTWTTTGKTHCSQMKSRSFSSQQPTHKTIGFGLTILTKFLQWNWWSMPLQSTSGQGFQQKARLNCISTKVQLGQDNTLQSLRRPKKTSTRCLATKNGRTNKKWTYQQDGATAHSANMTTAWLEDNVTEYIGHHD